MADDAPLCSEPSCFERAVVCVLKGRQRRSLPVCDGHAHYEALMAERYGYNLLIRGLTERTFGDSPNVRSVARGLG